MGEGLGITRRKLLTAAANGRRGGTRCAVPQAGTGARRGRPHPGRRASIRASTSTPDKTIVVRTAAHGEMGLAHGGLRQKNFNVYEESLRVPLVYSNPRLFRKARTSDALVSHVDFLPTLASLIGAPKAVRTAWNGKDSSRRTTSCHVRRLPGRAVERPVHPAASTATSRTSGSCTTSRTTRSTRRTSPTLSTR